MDVVPLAADTCWMLLVRHGATANNEAVPYKLQGRRLDAPLTESGWRQSAQAARFLTAWPVGAVYASPLLRARETAEAIAAPHRLRVEEVGELIECDIGAWEGRSWDDVAREEPESHRLFIDDPGTHGYRGGENLRQVEERVVPALARLMQDNLGGAIVVVGHNVVNRVYLGHLLGLPFAQRRRGVPQENCAINLIRFRAGVAGVLHVNYLGHVQSPDA
ncbi:MAG: histidine phosphatase family protein [Planctomycetia bacterium]|nr:histidine phosphatase family protein [Planctomycetia bacterium]